MGVKITGEGLWPSEGHGGEVTILLESARAFIAPTRITVSSPDERVKIELALNVAGHFVVMNVQFTGNPAHPVDASELRLGLNRIVTKVVKAHMRPAALSDDGLHWESRWEQGKGWNAEPTRDHEAAQVTRRARKRKISAEWLQAEIAPIVAECDRQGLSYGPVIAQKYEVKESTARGWVMKLREIEGQS